MSFCFFVSFFRFFLITAITCVEGTFQETFWSGPAFDSLCRSHCHLQCFDAQSEPASVVDCLNPSILLPCCFVFSRLSAY